MQLCVDVSWETHHGAYCSRADLIRRLLPLWRPERAKVPSRLPCGAFLQRGLHDSPDLAVARRVAHCLGTVHHELIYTVEEGRRVEGCHSRRGDV